MKNKEFDFLNKASSYIDSCFKIESKKYDFSRTCCYAEVEWNNDKIFLSKFSGIRYKPFSILKLKKLF